MNNAQSIKFARFNKAQEDTAKQIRTAVAPLNDHLGAAIEHQIYALTDPDSIMDESGIDMMLENVDDLIVKFSEVSEKVNDIIAVRNKTMTVEALVTKYKG